MKNIVSDIKNVISEFQPISLQEMDAVTLMNRLDFKYAFNIRRLPSILSVLSENYKVLEIDGIRGSHYKSTYFDTDDLSMYYDHHNGKPVRYKIRRREYVDSGLNFMEIKQKSSQGKTHKVRIMKHKGELNFTEKTASFIESQCPFESTELSPQLENYFIRYTLVHKTELERLTIDLNLTFSSESKECTLPYLVIAEVKREGDPLKSTFMNLMRNMSIRQSGMSKYCVGTVLLNSQIKYNRFKINILNLKKIENDTFRN